MKDEHASDPAKDPAELRTPGVRRRWCSVLIPLLLLGGLAWAGNWFYQRGRLFHEAHVVLGDPYLPWGRVIGDEAAREIFGMPLELHPKRHPLTRYQLGLIGGYPQLKSLQLHHMTDDDVRKLGDLVNLETLALLDSDVTDASCAIIGRLSALQWLEVNTGGNTNGDGLSDDGLKDLTSLTHLTGLSIQSPQITDAGLAHIGRLYRLFSLLIRDAQVHGPGFDHLADLNDLRFFSLYDCSLQGDALRRLADLPKLAMLSLEGCPVDDQMLMALIPVRSLTHVTLSRTLVTMEGCRKLLEARPDLAIDFDGHLLKAAVAQ